MKHLVTLAVSSLLGITGCAAESESSTSPATAQDVSAVLTSRCQEDLLSPADFQGRNAWALKCGFASQATVNFANQNFAYLVFTTGCGHAGCNPFVGVHMSDSCVAGLVLLGFCVQG